MGLNISGIVNKARAAITGGRKSLNPDDERRRLEDERVKDFEHRERMLRAEDMAKARVDADITAARQPKRQPIIKAVPMQTQQPKGNFGSRGHDALGLGGSGGSGMMDELAGFGNPPGTGTVRNGNPPGRSSFMDDLGNMGGSGGGGLDELLGMENRPQRGAPKKKKHSKRR